MRALTYQLCAVTSTVAGFFFWFVFLHVKGAFVTFGMLYRKIALVLLPVNLFSLTTGYIPGQSGSGCSALVLSFLAKIHTRTHPGRARLYLPYYNFIL